MPMSPREFAEYFKKDVEDIADLVKRAGIRAD
jgi:tripartite-type tricarboxylate transporter receptor subunit TctC